MSVTEVPEIKAFEPGTLGWTAADLEDPRIAELWFQGRYEIVDGVLTTMAPAYFTGGRSLHQLTLAVSLFQREHGVAGSFSVEVDMTLKMDRVAVADVVWMTPDDQRRQAEAVRSAGKADPSRTRLLVPPTLIVESVSPDKGRHDRVTKRRWYAEFGVPNYWLLDAYGKSLECLVLRGSEYQTEQAGSDDQIVRPGLFPGLEIPLKEIWGD